MIIEFVDDKPLRIQLTEKGPLINTHDLGVILGFPPDQTHVTQAQMRQAYQNLSESTRQQIAAIFHKWLIDTWN